ncbi:MAG: trypsin-like peptidase domain-containing protein, partial [Candidatus Promineifilaceae bacterium]
MPDFDWTNGIVAIYGAVDGIRRPVGTGFVVSAEGLILTCHHVLAKAGWSYRAWDEPVDVRFKATGRFAEALVQEDCFLVQTEGDFALLALQKELPDGVEPLRLWTARAAAGRTVAMYGYLAAFRQGLHGRGTVLGLAPRDGRQMLQLRSEEATHGYSGGPIWQPEWGRVIGMVKEGLTADEMGKHGNTTLGVPVEVLAEHCPSRLTLTPPESLIVQATRHISGAVEDLLDEYTAMVFVGRDDSLDALDAWLEEDESGRYVVTALAGFGKTSLLAHWLRRRQGQGDPGPEDQVAYHFFSQRFDVTRPVANLYANLLGQIADFEGQYDLTLPDEDRRPALLRRLIEERDPDADRRLIIVIDALDEAQNAFQLSLPDPLPPGVFLLVSARAGDWQAGAPQPRFLASWTEGARGRHLHELSRPAIQTWLRLAADGALERWSRDEAFVDRFANKTRGLPLYASYLIEDLIAAGDDAPGYLERAPRRFEAYISQQVDRFDELELPDEIYEFLSLLAVSPGAFHRDELKVLTGMRDRQIRRLRNVRDVARWLRVSEDGMFAFAHPLLAEGFAIALEDDAADAREKLLAWCAAWPDHHLPYAFRHYA